jgi:hypothetical protein
MEQKQFQIFKAKGQSQNKCKDDSAAASHTVRSNILNFL